MASPDDEVRSKLATLKVNDATESDITICCWNIMGEAKVEYRKMVTTKTFQRQFTTSTGKTSLGQADIICIQEMGFDPASRRVSLDYLPFIDEYKVVSKPEPSGTPHNAIFYKREKLTRKYQNDPIIERAFDLMEIKRKAYDKISRGGELEKKKAKKGELHPWGKEDDEKKMQLEVLEECKNGFDMDRYKAPDGTVTISPKDLLSRRMAICCLKVKSIDYSLVVISVHNYSKRSGVNAPKHFATLLFDFVKKLEVPVVVIAGDFNLDIKTERSLAKYLANYNIKDYEKKSLRIGLPRIDYIAFKFNASKNASSSETTAHDLQVPGDIEEAVGKPNETKADKHRKITNHNPLSATLHVHKRSQ